LLARNREPYDAGARELETLFHRLNNQLGIILANAELLEHRLTDETHRARAEQLVSGTLDAITTTQKLRQTVESALPKTE
jgi:hypothetical protein